MKKRIIFYFQILTALILILLAFATFFNQKGNPDTFSRVFLVKYLALDHFYDSIQNISLFSIMILLIFISIIFGVLKRKIQVTLHVIIAISFLIIIFDKSFNLRKIVPIREGTTHSFSELVNNESDTDILLHLNQFEIEHHPNSKMPKAFTSEIVIDNQDTVYINVNKPLKIGKYRLYQNAYEKIFLYEIDVNNEKYYLFSGDTISTAEYNIYLKIINSNYQKVLIGINNESGIVNSNGEKNIINNLPVKVTFVEMKFISKLEIAETTGMKLLLILGIGYLVVIGIAFWRKK